METVYKALLLLNKSEINFKKLNKINNRNVNITQFKYKTGNCQYAYNSIIIYSLNFLFSSILFYWNYLHLHQVFFYFIINRNAYFL